MTPAAGASGALVTGAGFIGSHLAFEDTRYRVPDITKLRSAIGYNPTRTLDGILNDVIRHFLGDACRAAV